MCRKNSMTGLSVFIMFFMSTVQLMKCEDFAYLNAQPNCSKINTYARIKHMLPQPAQNEPTFKRLNDIDDIYENHPCKRECVPNQRMTCYYYMVVHNDETMGPECAYYLNPAYRLQNDGDHEMYAVPHSIRMQNVLKNCKYADGVRTEIMIVNDQLIGMPIEMCEGDTVVADVINSMQDTTTIHWHGIHQRKTPHMDGVPHVTQYPIQPGQAFRYRFEVDHAGTNWWHSHTEHQRAFGLAGVFIVRQPKSDNVHELLYDFDLVEHTMMLQDWSHGYEEATPQNILVNGLGRNIHRNKPGVLKVATIYENFDVVQGARYRFRAIFNGIASCPISLSIDQHDLVVISSDGNDIEPVVVQKIIFNSAERFDFVVHANQPLDNYWIRLKGYNFCEPDQLHQEAILHYKGASRNVKPKGIVSYSYEPAGVVLNPMDEGPGDNPRSITIDETVALERKLEPPMKPFRTYYTSMAVYRKIDGLHFQMDDIKFTSPKVSLLQTRNLGIGGMFCNKSSLAASGINCREVECTCPNVIEVPAFKYVEFVISSNTAPAHPIHLHGYTFRVVGMGVLGEERIYDIEKIDKKTPLPRRGRGAPLKDSVQVPAFGYTIIRFYTDSPGYWILHCHISVHSEQGMAAVLKVGDADQMKLCPVSNCGLCGSMF